MKKRILTVVLLSCALAAAAPRAASSKAPASAGIEKQLEVYAARYLSYDPETKIAVTRSTETLPGFVAYKVKRTGRYEKLKVEKVFYVSEDGKWVFPGDT